MTERVCEAVGQGPFVASSVARWPGLNSADVPVGSDHMTRVVILAMRRGLASFSTSTAQTLWSHSSAVSTAGGWALTGRGSSNNQLRWEVARTPANNLVTVDSLVNIFRSPVLIAIGSFDLAGAISVLRVNGSNVTAAVTSAYRGPTEMMQIGARPTNNDQQYKDGSIIACLGTDSRSYLNTDLIELENELRERLANGREFTGILPNDVVYDARDAAGSLNWVPQGVAASTARTLARTGTIGLTGTPGRVLDME